MRGTKIFNEEMRNSLHSNNHLTNRLIGYYASLNGRSAYPTSMTIWRMVASNAITLSDFGWHWNWLGTGVKINYRYYEEHMIKQIVKSRVQQEFCYERNSPLSQKSDAPNFFPHPVRTWHSMINKVHCYKFL